MPVIVDTSNFNGFCRQIAAQPAVGLKAWDVMLFEVGKVLEACVRLTTRENLDKITRSIEFKNRTLPAPGNTYGRHTPLIYFTKKGLGWFYEEAGPGNEGKAIGPRNIGKSKTFHPMTEFFHYGNPRWARFQAALAQLKGKQIAVRDVIGRGANSWVQIGQKLGIQVNAPGYVRNPKAFRGRTYINGFARQSRGLFIEMTNAAPILLGTIDGNRILQTAINGRYKYFQQNLQRGVFDDVKTVAARYKGLVPA